MGMPFLSILKKMKRPFVDDGFGLYRKDVMYNDFVIVGPAADLAKVKASKDIKSAFTAIFDNKANFASRADDSGTHKTEMRLWQISNIDPRPDSGLWYLETGTGMGPPLILQLKKTPMRSLIERLGYLLQINNNTKYCLKVIRRYSTNGIIPISKAPARLLDRN